LISKRLRGFGLTLAWWKFLLALRMNPVGC